MALPLNTPPPAGSMSPPEADEFSWVPPDLSIGSPFCVARVANLELAVRAYPRARWKKLRDDGMEALRINRGNYTQLVPQPKQLQLLWWEFPPEYWEEIREGGSMNFMHPPEPGIHPNGTMKGTHLDAGAAFVEEMHELKILQPHDNIVTTAPMFVLPKADQPEQWRVLANLKEGGQKAAVASDLVYLNRLTHILEKMYTGGYSAVVEASKFFYQFTTQAEERKYLALHHLVTGELLACRGVPMGAGNSPALAERFGLSFVSVLTQRFAVFQETHKANKWWKGFESDGTYNPKLGHGYVLVGPDGFPSVKIWVHVDDFLIHGPTLDSTRRALMLFFVTSRKVGTTPAGGQVLRVHFGYEFHPNHAHPDS